MSWAALVVAIASAWRSDVRAEVRDGFETPATAWKVQDRDCPLQLTRQERLYGDAHEGAAVEQFEFVAGNGSYVHAVYALPPSRVIDELVPRLWLRANRGGMRLYARVVLPRSQDPRNGATLTALVGGDSYESNGAWSQLAIRGLPALLEEQARALRQRLQANVDTREAYIDQLVLNLYGGAGPTVVAVDDLEVEGVVERAPVSGQAAAAWAGSGSTIEVRGGLLTVAERPMFVRAVRYHGEPLEFLSGLGFNTIYVAGPAPRALLDSAQQHQLWVVSGASPTGVEPGVVGLRDDDRDWSPGAGRRPASPRTTSAQAPPAALAWTLGDQLTPADLPRARELLAIARVQGGTRPVVAGVRQGVAAFSELADVVMLGREVSATSFPLDQLGEWYRGAAGRLSLGCPWWAVIALDPPRAWLRQVEAGVQDVEALDPAPEQLRLAALHAVASGARGVFFDSQRPLHASTPGTRLRTAALRLINQELQTIEPWLAGGRGAVSVAHPDMSLHISRLDTDRSQLMVVLRSGAWQQLESPATEARELSVVASPTAGSSGAAYLLGADGPQPLTTRRVPGGVQVEWESSSSADLVVLTQDPLVLHHLTTLASSFRETRTELSQQIAFQWLSRTADVDRRLAALGHSAPESAKRLEAADAKLRGAQQWAREGRHGVATRDAQDALRELAELRRTHWEHSIGETADPAASPACLAFETLPFHWALGQRIGLRHWGPNLLSGGQLESRQEVESAGWENHRGDDPDLTTRVEFSTTDRHSGKASLYLRCETAPGRGAPRLVEAPPVRIVSAPVSAVRGQLLRVQGWLHVPQPPLATLDGVRVTDLAGGDALALRIGQTDGWRPFVLYRTATDNGPFRVVIELTGIGECYLDELSVAALE